MTDPVLVLRRDYVPPFLAYLAHRDEAGLGAAYELGRRALRQAVGVLVLVRIHEEVLLDVLRTTRTAAEATEMAEAASAFLFEAVAPFEMTQRLFRATSVTESD